MMIQRTMSSQGCCGKVTPPNLSQGWETIVAAAISTATSIFGGKSGSGSTVESNMSNFMNQNVKYNQVVRQALNNLIQKDITTNPGDWTWVQKYAADIPAFVTTFGGTPVTEGDSAYQSSPNTYDPNYIWIGLDHVRTSIDSSVWNADVASYQGKLAALLKNANTVASSSGTTVTSVLTQVANGASSLIKSITGQNTSPTSAISTASIAAGLPFILIIGAAAWFVFGKKGKKK